MRRLAALLAVCAAPLPALAYTSSEGRSYDIACNSSGFVLSGAGGETLYLGKSCDAARAGETKGQWCWANGGFLVTFDQARIGFARQELNCPLGGPQIDLLNLSCGCT